MTIAKSNFGNKQTFAKNLNKYITIWEEKGYTKEMIAKELGVPITTFAGWYRGEYYPRIDKIEKMAAFFGTTKSCLVEEHALTPEQTEMIDIIIGTDKGDELISVISKLDESQYETLLAYAKFLGKE